MSSSLQRASRVRSLASSALLAAAAIAAVGATACRTPRGSRDEHVASTAQITFRSDRLLNQHQWLLAKALEWRQPVTVDGPRERLLRGLATEAGVEPSPSEAEACVAAVEAYARDIAPKDPLFDAEMTRVKYALVDARDLEELGRLIPKSPVLEPMERAFDYYAAHLWPAQDRDNRDFLGDKLALIGRIEEGVFARCERVLGERCRGLPMQVELVGFASRFGAYTTSEPSILAVVSSRDARHRGTQGIEIVFHEVSHAMAGRLIETQDRVVGEAGAGDDPRFGPVLWHTILFVTTGSFVRDELSKLGIEHRLYVDENQLGRVAPAFQAVLDAVHAHWPAVLDGRLNLEEGLRAICGPGDAPLRRG